MIAKKTKELGIQVFWLLAVATILAIPGTIFLNAVAPRVSPLTGLTSTADGWLVLFGLAVYALVLLGMLFFKVVPAAVELARAIAKQRQEANGDLFP